ncbi:exonuclease [Arthrobacter phage Sonny]|uniref:Exonuclease n=2 Tax=Marthavirus shade TaxID=2560306 RepID=A0A0U4B6G6_9CAUD|nr:RecE-like recombination exonuclease [Arthrobacter phage Sonny]YP_009612487.1 RecE-like recombination exonuclease [Arthrobacter phage Shade]ALY10302.1 exonuclease [Arthrobacter phage Sonny]ASR80739.1 exonuclease [Arthrobacter phage Shade]
MSVNYKTPGSTLVLPAKAERELWLAERTKGIGGSDISAILGLNKWKSAYGVYNEKIGVAPEIKANAAMRWGLLLEGAMRQAFMEDTGLKVRSAGLHRSKERDYAQITVDGLVSDGGNFESKTLQQWTADEWEEDQVSDHAELQVQWGMYVTGRRHSWVVGLIDGRDFRTRRVEYDPQLVEIILNTADHFWHEYVQKRVAPPMTAVSFEEVRSLYRVGIEDKDRTLTTDELFTLSALDVELKKLKAQIKADESEERRVQAEIRALIGDNWAVRNQQGELVKTLVNNGTFAAKRFAEDHPDKIEQYSVAKSVFDPNLLKAAEPELHTEYRARVLRDAPKKKESK